MDLILLLQTHSSLFQGLNLLIHGRPLRRSKPKGGRVHLAQKAGDRFSVMNVVCDHSSSSPFSSGFLSKITCPFKDILSKTACCSRWSSAVSSSVCGNGVKCVHSAKYLALRLCSSRVMLYRWSGLLKHSTRAWSLLFLGYSRWAHVSFKLIIIFV